jgi:hypothetical protein
MSLVKKRILFVRSGDGEPIDIDGFISTDNLNTIFISVDSRAGLTYLYWQEIGYSTSMLDISPTFL